MNSPRSWRRLTLLAVMYSALALIAYQIHPAAPVVLLWFRLCFGDVLDAVWLARRDPNPKRGRIVALWYLTRAMWHAGAWAFLLMILFYLGIRIALGAEIPGPIYGRFAVAVESIEAVLITMSSGMFVAALVMTYAGVIWTTMKRQPVWLGKDVRRWRESDQFPPFVSERLCSVNDALSLTTIVAFSVGVGATSLTIWGIVLAYRAIPCRNAGNDALIDVTMAVVGLVVPIAVLIDSTLRGQRISGVCVAETPEACWTDSQHEPPEGA